jgi:hypothetical protein
MSMKSNGLSTKSNAVIVGGYDSYCSCGARTLPVAKAKQEVSVAKIDLDSLNIAELALLRDRTIEKLAEKVAARHD